MGAGCKMEVLKDILTQEAEHREIVWKNQGDIYRLEYVGSVVCKLNLNSLHIFI